MRGGTQGGSGYGNIFNNNNNAIGYNTNNNI
jgi:hypothetical protein